MLFGNEQNPKGPSWRRLRTVDKNVSGTSIRFSAPSLRLPLRGRDELEDQADQFDLGDTSIYKPYESSGNPDGILNVRLWLSGWNFTGRPLLDGETLGDLVLRLSVLNVTDLAVNQSLFSRCAMVGLVNRLHVVTHLGEEHTGHAENRDPFDLTEYRWPNHLSPINSQWLNRNGSEWLYFESQPLWTGSEDYYWLTPIGHQHCLFGHFMAQRWLRNAGNPYRQSERSPISNYRQLMERIMDSITVELSGEARAAQKRVHNPEDVFPLPHIAERLVKEAKHTLYMWSGKGFTDKTQPKQGGDHRAPKEDVAAFIDQRIQPRPLPGCLAIGPAFVESEDKTSGACDDAGKPPCRLESD